jgi:hypothetical protein
LPSSTIACAALVIPTPPVSRDRRVDAIQSRRFAFVGRVAAQLQEIRLRRHPREGGVHGADLGALLSASGSPGPTDIDFSFLPSFLPSQAPTRQRGSMARNKVPNSSQHDVTFPAGAP